LLPLIACGSVQGQQPDGGLDASPTDGRTVDTPDPGPTIQISGALREAGTGTAVVGAAVDVIRISDRMRLASTNAGAEGVYAVTVSTHDAPVDAYLDVTDANHLRTRVYLIPQLSSDSSADAYLFTGRILQDCADAAGVSQPTSTGFILAQLFEASQPALQATAAVTPSGQVFYTDPSTSAPGAARTATADDGQVWAFAVEPGLASVSGKLGDGVAVHARQVSVEANMVIEIGLEP
jgi:hypothetical protein